MNECLERRKEMRGPIECVRKRAAFVTVFKTFSVSKNQVDADKNETL